MPLGQKKRAESMILSAAHLDEHTSHRNSSSEGEHGHSLSTKEPPTPPTPPPRARTYVPRYDLASSSYRGERERERARERETDRQTNRHTRRAKGEGRRVHQSWNEESTMSMKSCYPSDPQIQGSETCSFVKACTDRSNSCNERSRRRRAERKRSKIHQRSR